LEQVTVHSARYKPAATAESEPIVQAALTAAGKRRRSALRPPDQAFLRDIPAVKVDRATPPGSHRPNEICISANSRRGKFYAALVAPTSRSHERGGSSEMLWAKDLR
jgi:hypothetical protein